MYLSFQAYFLSDLGPGRHKKLWCDKQESKPEEPPPAEECIPLPGPTYSGGRQTHSYGSILVVQSAAYNPELPGLPRVD